MGALDDAVKVDRVERLDEGKFCRTVEGDTLIAVLRTELALALRIEEDNDDDGDEEDELAALAYDAEFESSSGHIPVVQGSLEQHPINPPPAEQTYHSFEPVQLVDTRRDRTSIIRAVSDPEENVARKPPSLQWRDKILNRTQRGQTKGLFV